MDDFTMVHELPIRLVYDEAEHVFRFICRNHEWVGEVIPRWQIKKGEVLAAMFAHLRDQHAGEE